VEREELGTGEDLARHLRAWAEDITLSRVARGHVHGEARHGDDGAAASATTVVRATDVGQRGISVGSTHSLSASSISTHSASASLRRATTKARNAAESIRARCRCRRGCERHSLG
jgi:uncharacterized alpha-E superfamily protein